MENDHAEQEALFAVQVLLDNSAAQRPANMPKRRRMRTKQTPTPSTSAASETDPLGGSLLGEPAGDVRRVESDVETVYAASVDLPELLEELDDEQVEDSGDRFKALQNALGYWKRRRLLQCGDNERQKKRIMRECQMRGKSREEKKALLEKFARTLPLDSSLHADIAAMKTSIDNELKKVEKNKNRQGSHMLTYQGDWGVIQDPAWTVKIPSILNQGSHPFMSDFEKNAIIVDSAVRMIHHMPFYQPLRESFLKKIADVVTKKFIQHWAFTLEICPHALLEEGNLRVHAHVFFASTDKFVLTPEECEHLGTRPHRTHGILNMTSSRSSRNFSGMYYVLAEKIGTVCTNTSTPAFTGFPVQPQWILSLVQAEKMTYDVARADLVRCAKDVLRSTSTLDKWHQEMKAAFMKKKAFDMQEFLRTQSKEFVIIPPVEAWIEDHRICKARYKFLVLHGKSGLGKTQYALHLAPVGRTLDLNMAASDTPDLRAYDPMIHDLILFDEMKAKAILQHKKLFQAPATELSLGNSSTNCYAYTRWLHQKLLVVSTNRWFTELEELPSVDASWLTQNALVIHVTAPLWVPEGRSDVTLHRCPDAIITDPSGSD